MTSCLPVRERSLQDAEHLLLRHRWPGSVRALRAAVQRSVLMSVGDAIDADVSGLSADANVAPRNALLTSRMPSQLAHAPRTRLNASDGVQAQAALELGLSRHALCRRSEKLDVGRDGCSRTAYRWVCV